MNVSTINKSKILAATFAAGILLFISACGDKKPEVIEAVSDRKQMPQLHANEVTTLVSDSGVTRYRLTTSEWNIYDKAEPPYWEFPEGLHIERFDLDLNVDANIRGRYAKYFEKKELWLLQGEVNATNLEGEHFETERLYWDQRKEQIYSDTIVKITDATGTVIYGDHFVSNQSLSNYTIKNGRADIILKEEQ